MYQTTATTDFHVDNTIVLVYGSVGNGTRIKLVWKKKKTHPGKD